MFRHLSLRGRFLFAPLVCVLLTLFLFFASNVVNHSSNETLKQLSDSNLPRMTEISDISIRLTNNHSLFSSLLISALDDPDEERIYLEGRSILNSLYELEEKVRINLLESDALLINGEDVLQKIGLAFKQYREACVGGLELSTVDAALARVELINATQTLVDLNGFFLILSNYYGNKLSISTDLIDGALADNVQLTAVAVSLLLMMIFVALYFSKKMSQDLEQVNQALIDLSNGRGIKYLPKNSDGDMQQLTTAVYAFEEALRQSEVQQLELDKALRDLQQQKFALDQHAIVAITNVKGDITYANKRFSEISGYNIEELLGKNHRLLNSGKHDSSLFTEMYKTISKGGVWHGELCNKNKNGELYWVDTTIAPFMGDDGKPVSYIAIRTDITTSKDVEIDLLVAKEAAEAAVIAKNEFLATMSHEIRTPMNGVLGMLGLLLNMSLSEEQERRAKLAQVSAKSLLGLIDDILDFSRVEAGKLDFEALDFDLRYLLGEFAETMALRAGEKGLELIVDLTGMDDPMVVGDPGRVRQILSNLVGNAIKFTEAGEILIRASMEKNVDGDSVLRCSIKDTGVGIPPHRLEYLFDMFTQVDASTTRKFGGTGLGLSIAKKLCELMHGDISVDSTLGEGSDFEFFITLKSSEHSIPEVPDIDISKLHILVVDDNATNREVVQAQLLRWGASVEQADSAEAALELMSIQVEEGREVPFDIAIVDMQMPDIDGAEFGKRVKGNAQYNNVKLVMMTSMAHRGDACFFAELGYDAYFPKPVTTEDLFKALTVVDSDSQNLLVTRHSLGGIDNVESKIIPLPELIASRASMTAEHVRILLVEDNVINQEVARGILEDLGFDVDIAADGAQCIESLKQNVGSTAYQLVLMDCQMPIMDGYKATREIREGNAGAVNQYIPVIAMTANAMKGDREKCLATGMNDYLSKPIDEGGLLKKINNLLYKEKTKLQTPENQQTPDNPTVTEITANPGSVSDIWDRREVLSRLRGKEDRLLKIMGLFVKNAPLMIKSIESAIAMGDLQQVKIHIHSLKEHSVLPSFIEWLFKWRVQPLAVICLR